MIKVDFEVKIKRDLLFSLSFQPFIFTILQIWYDHDAIEEWLNLPATVDFPTPPLPEATTIILSTPFILDFWGGPGGPLRGIVGAGLGFRRGRP